MFSSGYPRSYNPYSYAQSPFGGRQPSYGDALRARTLAEQRARRAQWLPDEVDEDNGDEATYGQLSPRERAYLGALREQHRLEQARREKAEELARQKATEQQKWQAALEARKREGEELRQKFLQQRQEEASRQMAAANERQRMLQAEQQRQERARSTSRGRESNTVPINFRRSTSPPLPQSRPTSTSSPHKETPSPATRPVYNEVHENAALKIQQQYRIHQSYKALDALASQFQALKSEFVYPRIIDFQQPSSEEGHISVRANRPPSDFDHVPEVETEETSMAVDGAEPKLAYTSVNYPLHTYTDAMDKILIKLDGVESWGEKAVRERRRSIVREISEESAKLDRYWKQTWVDHIEGQKQEVVPAGSQPETDVVSEPEEIQTQHDMEFDDEPIRVEIHEGKSEDDEWLQVDEVKAEEVTETTPNLKPTPDVE